MSRALWVGLTLALLISAAPAVAIEVAIVKPDPGVAVFGVVEVEAEIYPPDANIERVEFYLDGLQVGLLRQPPYRLLLDFGQDNREHHVEIVAFDLAGDSASNSLRTSAVKTNLVIDVELQQLYLTVERNGERLLDLEEEDFRVLDEGVGQELVTFERGEVPFTAAVVLDSSTSMQGRMLPTAIEGAKAFIRAMKPLDEAKLLLFSDQVQFETPFTNSSTILGVGLGGVRAGGGSSINDTLYLAQKRLEPRQGRKVIILLSDGVDVESVLDMEQIQWITRSRQAAIYWIRLPRPGETKHTQVSTAWRSSREHSRERDLLAATVVESGGQILEVSSVDEVQGAFQQLLEELREQYVLGYYPSVTRGAGEWHDIEVRIGRRDVVVRTRSGYLEG